MKIFTKVPVHFVLLFKVEVASRGLKKVLEELDMDQSDLPFSVEVALFMDQDLRPLIFTCYRSTLVFLDSRQLFLLN